MSGLWSPDKSPMQSIPAAGQSKIKSWLNITLKLRFIPAVSLGLGLLSYFVPKKPKHGSKTGTDGFRVSGTPLSAPRFPHWQLSHHPKEKH